MRRCSKVSVALAACWLFAVPVISDFLTFSSGSTTGSVEVLDETSLQSVVSAPSTEFTVWEFYTLMAPGATPANTASFVAAVSYPEITTVAVFPQVVSSTALVTSPLSTAVDVVYTLVLGSVTPVGSPGISLPTTTTLPKETTLVTSTTLTPPSPQSPLPTPAPTPAPAPNPAPAQPSTKAASMFAKGTCGRPGEPDGGKCGA